MTQSYAVYYVHDTSIYNGSFLLATKLDMGYYFADRGGRVVAAGERLNGAGKPALPGGRVNAGESLDRAAEREFHEETGYSMRYRAWRQQGFSVAGQKFGAGYFVTDWATLSTFRDDIQGTTLPASKLIVGEILAKRITAYDQIGPWVRAHVATAWPPSNELAAVEVRNILHVDTWRMVQSWAHDSDLDWFYHILRYLRVDILGARGDDAVEARPRPGDEATAPSPELVESPA